MFNVVIFENSFPDKDYPTVEYFDLSTCKRINDLSNLYAITPKVTTIPNKLGLLEDGASAFANNFNITEFAGDLSSLKNGSDMFYECTALSKVNANLGKLVDGNYMFSGSALLLFTGDLRNLRSGYEMFTSYDWGTGDGVLSIFNTTNLDSLLLGNYMFTCSLLPEFTYDLKSLRRAESMFSWSTVLKKFCGDTSKLVEAPCMFENCALLSDFIGDLSSLVVGRCMFYDCKLNAKSVMYIAETIRDLQEEYSQYSQGEKDYISLTESAKEFSQGYFSEDRNDYAYAILIPNTRDMSIDAIDVDMVSVEGWHLGIITIGIDVSEDEINGKDHEQQKLEFANEIGYSTWEDLNQAFVDKGWQVEWQFNGPVLTTYRMTRNKKTLPVYAKLIEIQPEGLEEGKDEKVYTKRQKRYAKYCTQDGSKYYNISWGHEVSNTEDYTKYDSIQDVLDKNGLIRKEELLQS